ncbi:LamG-like jellyroll fold domain-containing protein [Flavobacterium sp. HNIBRBA15423]|uniref:LamG-like jellyroll fold domain-containing protein n=1 Tax=Flavobacterium sp. HNIBRBA15423 TaxID=3458683 RepID=UPI00404518AF
MKIKNLLYVTTAILIVSCSKDSKDQEDDLKNIPSDGLVAYYTLDNEALDKSINNNDGEIIEANGSTDRMEKENGALEFNGINSKVVLTTQIDDALSTGLTFSAWIHYTGETTGRVLSNYNGEGQSGNCNERIGFNFGVTDDKQLNIHYAIDGDNFIGRKTNPNAINANEWVHILGTWDGTLTSSGFKLYINGIQLDTENHETGTIPCDYLQSLIPFYIGMGHCAAGECAPFEGKIDDVRIYNKELSLEDIKLLSEE